MAERAVGSLKNSLKATLAADDSGGMELALARVLMAYRATPHVSTGRTPAEVLLGRNIRTRLNLLVPTAEDALRDSAERQQTAAGGRARAFAVGADATSGTAPAEDRGRADAAALASDRYWPPSVGRDGGEGSGVSSSGAISRSNGASQPERARVIGAGAERPSDTAAERPAGAAASDSPEARAAAGTDGAAAGRSAGAGAAHWTGAAPAADSAGGSRDGTAAEEPSRGPTRDGTTAERAALNESAAARPGVTAGPAGRADRHAELTVPRHSTRRAAPPRRYIEEL
ncbi:dynein axonemal assembly factor 3 homolog [Amphibalanus amphitrite]|uniref:dynein axonemal assembly factor 3 homolog n=1 Tax=Amphibalanus amphitrite TaxID=1232801 RepID=UPI001C8FDE87|nr:dynein axonemal assembly factor 3 homolog [Amphibalanus amphitrite]